MATKRKAAARSDRRRATSPADADSVLRELESMGTEQTRKAYRRRGAPEPLFGVSRTNLGALKKRIRENHLLARRLWTTGNTDARSLAAMIASPGELSEAEADAWVHEARYHYLIDSLTSLISRTPYALRKALEWIGSEDEFVGRAGWALISRLALSDAVPDDRLLPLLPQIEAGIHGARNRKREGMLHALVAIGEVRDGLRGAALDTAGRIGKVEIDQGETGSQTHEPAATIRRAAETPSGKARG